MKLLLLLGMVAGLLTSCQPADSTYTTSAAGSGASTVTAPAAAGPTKASVMRQHDAQMARTDVLATERQRLTAALSRLDTATASRAVQARRLRRIAAALAAADAAMMDWMHHYQEPDSARLTGPQYQAFWADQARQLNAVEDHMTAALDSARTLR